MEIAANLEAAVEQKKALEQIKGVFRRTYVAGIVTIGTILTEIYAPNEFNLRTGASLGKHVLEAVPSVFEPADASAAIIGKDNPELDLTIDLVPLTVGGVAAASTTKKASHLVELAFAAQVAASSTDAALAEGGLIDRAEMAEKDVGSSSIMMALWSKFLFDKIATTDDERKKRALQLVTGTFIGALTVGAAVVDSKHFYTDFASHLVAAGAGWLGSKREQRQAAKVYEFKRPPDPDSDNDAAAEALVA